jgi:hypothetical protein
MRSEFVELKIKNLLCIAVLFFVFVGDVKAEEANKFPEALAKKIQEVEGLDGDYIQELSKILDAVGVPLTGPFDNAEDIYRNSTNVTLGGNTYKIPKAYVRPFTVSDEYDGNDISREGEVNIILEYVIPDKHSTLEHLFVREDKIEQVVQEGNLVRLFLKDPREDFSWEKYNEIVGMSTAVPEQDREGLFAYKMTTNNDRISYFDISGDNFLGWIQCQPEPEKKPETEPDCEDVMKNFGKAKREDRMFCAGVDTIRKPAECHHMFYHQGLVYMLYWSSSHFSEWKGMKNQAIEFVNGFNVSP